MSLLRLKYPTVLAKLSLHSHRTKYLSYLISKPFRGMGLSKIMLKMAIKKKIKIRNNNITAVSFIENEISNKILLSLGFKIFSKNINTFNYRYSYNN